MNESINTMRKVGYNILLLSKHSNINERNAISTNNIRSCSVINHQWLALDLSHGRSLHTSHSLPQPRSLECGQQEREEKKCGA